MNYNKKRCNYIFVYQEERASVSEDFLDVRLSRLIK